MEFLLGEIEILILDYCDVYSPENTQITIDCKLSRWTVWYMDCISIKLILWVQLCLPKRYVKIQTPSTCDYGLIYK